MRKFKAKAAIGLLVGVLMVTATMTVLPTGTNDTSTHSTPEEKNTINIIPETENEDNTPYLLDFSIREDPSDEPATANMQEDENDANYNTDTGNNILKSLPLYPGETNDRAPGRGTEGQLDPSGDEDDWYYFSVQGGQTIDVRITPESNFDIELMNSEAVAVATSANSGTSVESFQYAVESTGRYFLHIYTGEGAAAGSYGIDVTLQGQNDAGSSSDAGDTIASAMSISPGFYEGYLDVDDWEDWYHFSANTGQGIRIALEVNGEKSDFDVHLYNPSGALVHRAMYYGDDVLEYPADATGTWSAKIEIWPGWDAEKWPDNYFLYGSGPYEFQLDVGVAVDAPPAPVPQPDITPVAQTFIVTNDDSSNADEYGYLAAVPAANYIDGGKRYVSLIAYQGDDYIPTWFTTVDDTTQYLIDDWNTYLDRHDMTAEEYMVDSDPIKAAADIATEHWSSSGTVVVAVDGSSIEGEVITIVDQASSLSSTPQVTRLLPDSPKFKDVGGNLAAPMFIGKDVGAIHLIAVGDSFSGDTGVITPRYESVMEDWWPYPYDENGVDMDTFYPVTLPGFWAPYVTTASGLDELQIIKYAGDRYTIPVETTDCSIEVTIATDELSSLIVYLVDPYGNVRRPSIPHYNGGEIPTIHNWPGGHWQHNYDEFRTWTVEPHLDYTVEVYYPMTGDWTAIVVPYLEMDGAASSFIGEYHITANIREHGDRPAAALSAANGAVIASLNHAPLLYVTEDSVPSETSDAIATLGASNVIFVNIDGVSSASVSGATEYTTMQDVVNAIKESPYSENYITITSFGSGDGYFAPAAMAAAYHGSPVINIGDAPDAYDKLDKLRTWAEYAGDFYHGARSLGHPPNMNAPFDWKEAIKDFFTDQELPPLGFDLEKRWPSEIHDGIYNNITAKYGLDLQGQEAYLFVADRDTDIRDFASRIMMGNNSYAGQIPGATVAFASAHIVRCILYPAVMYANPGRDVTTTQLMNFPDGRTWTTNDGKATQARSSQSFKLAFSSHNRFYEGHCTWEGLLERFNEGVSVWYYSGHGTGGSGISAQYTNVAETYPYVELRHEQLEDFEWWDGWRGYMYDDKQTKDPRWCGFTWYNAIEPNLYDIIHFKWVDQSLGNLHGIWDLWMSCTTQAHLGPIVMLSHGGTICYGNIWSGLCPMSDLMDDWWTVDVFVNGDSIGEAFSRYLWLFQRDFTTDDPTAMYGSSSLTGDGGQVVFGDPAMTCYSPDWIEPTPVTP